MILSSSELSAQIEKEKLKNHSTQLHSTISCWNTTLTSVMFYNFMMAFLVLNPLTTKPEIVWDKIMNPKKKIFNSIDVIVNPAI